MSVQQGTGDLVRRGGGATPVRTEGASRIRFEDVTVTYGTLVVLRSLSLTVDPGGIVALIGPSGSGKTTALRAVAGFVRPSSGRILIGERDVTDVPPFDRKIGMVVQNYALFPHMRVDENVAFGLRAQGARADVIRARVPECLRMVGMAGYEKRFPRQLSGGQQQRVAIARALATRPQVLLLDEPLSALDAQIRRNMLEELANLHRDLPDLTVLYVTHDQSEALTLADHIGIMRDGCLQAFGSAKSLFRNPPNRFSAEFLGRANLLPFTDMRARGDARVSVRFGTVRLDACNEHGLSEGSGGLLCVRPHALKLASPGEGANRLEAQVRAVQWKGDTHEITAVAGDTEVQITSDPLRDPPAPGATIGLHFDPADATVIPEDPGDG